MASASVMQPVALAAAPVEAPAAAAAAAAPAQAGEKESAPPAAPTSRAVKVSTPQIHWHGKSPVFAIDFHPHNPRLVVTAGAEPDGVGGVHLWIVHDSESQRDKAEGGKGLPPVSFVQDLQGHEKPVNCVRFSPNGEFLATAGVEGLIVIWRRTMVALTNEAAIDKGAEKWEHHCILRTHVLDVADLAWSPTSLYMASGSTDNTSAIFNVFSPKDKVAASIRDHSHFVLGVGWDPLDEYVVTVSSDRSVRLNASTSGKWKGDCKTAHIACKSDFEVKPAAVFRTPLPEGKRDNTPQHFKLFLDDTVAAHRRRPAWSPDGLMCVIPGGVHQASATSSQSFCSHVLARRAPTKPICYLPSGKQPSIAARFCPVLFKLPDAQGVDGDVVDLEEGDGSATPGKRQQDKGDGPLPTPSRLFEAGGNAAQPSVLNTPYAMVFAIATTDSIIVYSSQSTRPVLYVSGIHYSPITDISWSADARFLIATSSDGYCTITEFLPGELGEPLDLEDYPEAAKPKRTGKSGETLAREAAGMFTEAPGTTPAPAAAAAAPPAAPPAGCDAGGSGKKRRIVPVVVKDGGAAAGGGEAAAEVTAAPAAAPAAAPVDSSAVDDTKEVGSTAEAEEEKREAGNGSGVKKRRIVPTVSSA